MSRLHDKACASTKVSSLCVGLAIALAAAAIALPSVSFAQWTAIELPGADFTFMTDVAFPLSATGYLVGWESGKKGVIMKTSNGGTDWQRTDVDNAQLHGVKFLDANTGVAVGYDYECKCGLMLITDDGGENWSPTTYPSVAGLRGIEIAPDNTLHASGGAGTVLKSTDRGVEWTESHTDAGGQYKVTQFLDALTGFAVAASGEFGLTKTAYRTIDGGAGWDLIFTEENAIANDVFFISPQIGFVVGGFVNGDLLLPALYKTTDGGATWQRAWTGTLSPSFLQDVHFITPQIGFVVGDDGTVLGTTDGGTTWDPEFPPVSDGLKSIEFEDGVVYATGDMGILISRTVGIPQPIAVLSTEALDFGGVGTQQSRTLSVTISTGNQVPLTIDTVFIAEGGEGKGFALLAPHGDTFPITLNAGESEEITVRFSPAVIGAVESSLTVRSNDGGSPERSLALMGSGTSTSSVSSGSVLERTELFVQPNPVGSMGEVVLRVPSRGSVTVTLHDVLGKRISTLFSGQVEAGEKRLAIDYSRLDPGVYYCVMEGESGRVENVVIVGR